jgi:hypothetical protein
MALFQGKNLTSSNLVLHLDATNTRSYSGSGNTWYDLSGFGNNGTLNNGVLYNSYGGFFEFDGSNDYIEIPHASSLNIGTGTSATIEIIYDVYNFSTASSLIAKRSSDVSTATDYMIFTSNDLYWLTGDSSGTGNSLPTSSFRENRNIQTVTATINSSTTNKKIYKDGSQVISSTYASKVASNSASVFLGKHFGSGFYFNGRIYSVKIYNRELTDTEIANNFQANKLKYTYNLPIVRDGLLIHYDATNPLSYAGVGTIWYDISGNNYHSILYNGPAFTGTGSTAYFYFDGTNDYGETISSISETVTEATFSTWVYYDGTPDTFDAIIFDRGSATGLNTHNSNYVSTHWNNDGKENFNSGIVPAANKWNYMVGTVSPTESNYYLNDVRGNTQVTSRAAHTFGQLQLARDSAVLGRYTKGRISQILLYDRELSANEVMQNYRALKGRYFSIPQQNLILHLDAGDVNSYPGGGASWFEISGSGSTATLTNSPTFTATYGGGFVLNGTNQYATVPTASRFDLGTGSATIIAWFKTTASGLTNIVSKRNVTGFQLHVYNNNLYADGAGTAGKSSSQIVNNGKIFCGAVVYDRASSLMRLYINGVEDGNVALASTTLTDVANVNVGYTTFGGSPGYYFNGTIYQVQIYNKALSPKEMRENFELLRSRYGV